MQILDKTFTTKKFSVSLLVEDRETGNRLDQFMQTYLESWSRQLIKKKIDSGEIFIDERPGKIKPSSKVNLGDVVKMETLRGTLEDEYWNGEKLPTDLDPEIVFEDDDLIVINKPAYMSTHPTGKHLFNCATVFFEEIHQRTIHSIHRLDRETTGVLLLGKNPKAANRLTEEFEKDQVKKCYFFIAEDRDKDNKDTFTAKERLGSDNSGLERVFINHYEKDSTQGKKAITHFKVLHRENGYVMGLAFPVTGRQHQIRVHAMIHGYPLVGDKLYLGSFEMFQRFKDLIASKEDHDAMILPSHALHNCALEISHNKTKSLFKAGIPLLLDRFIRKNFSLEISNLEQMIFKNVESEFSKLKN